MSDLMSRGASLIVRRKGTSRKRLVEDNDTIVLGVGCVVGREGGVTEETRAIASGETDGVEVEGAGGTLSESVLHGGLLGGIWSGAIEPGGIQGPGGVRQLETETGAGVVLIQDVDLISDLGVAEVDDRN